MSTPTPELSEKDFIQDGFKNPLPYWVWFFLLTIFVSLLWGGASWYYDRLALLIQKSPFLQVTNRELSLFLWQNPEFMRANVQNKNSYLPGFQYQNKVTLELANADDYVIAPPELLFRYHAWGRLISKEFSPRPIPVKEFREFLKNVEEWQPQHWPKAPQDYVKLVNELPQTNLTNLEALSKSVLPQEVRLAFQGWKNYYKEGEAINNIKPSFQKMQQFISKNPHYARNYWRNIVERNTPKYLQTLASQQFDSSSPIPSEELTPFLKVGIYNFLKSNLEE